MRIRSQSISLLLILSLLTMLIGSCGDTQPVPSATAQPTDQTSELAPTASPKPSATATATPTPTSPPTTTPPPTATPTSVPAEEYREPGDHVVTIPVRDAEREFVLHIPPGYELGVPMPLVLNLHGYSGTAYGQQKLSQMNTTADREGFLVVYPQALYNPPAWHGAEPTREGAADVRFFVELIAHLQREISIDPARIFATGFSNGATMTNHLGCTMSDVFAAIAPVAGGHVGYPECRIEQPVSVLAFHGTDDRAIPYDGSASGIPSTHDWVQAWAERNGCEPAPTASQPHEEVTQETWLNCDADAEVTLYTIVGGRHDWPGSGFGPGPYPEGLAPDIYATDVIWEFFKAHPKPLGAVAQAPAGSPPAIPSLGERYQTPGDYMDFITVGDFQRWFTVHLPPGYQPGTPLPLVVNLHAFSSTMFQQEEVSGMNAKADEEGFIVVNPQAIGEPPSWWGPLPGPHGQPDRDFFVALLDYLQERISIDPARIYATGLSNGGTMSYALGCAMADVFAAIAPVSGGHAAHDLCIPKNPISVLVIHGSDDQVIPYHGSGTDSAPVHVWLEAWAQHNGCNAAPEASRPYESVLQETWGDCDENVEVTLLTLEGGGHTWPGAPPVMTSGASFSYMNATDVIWAFFEAHPKPVEPPE